MMQKNPDYTDKRKKINYSFVSRGLFPGEEKGCDKGIRGTNNLLYIDKQILKEATTWQKNVAVIWIDNKNSYNKVP